MVYNNLIQFIKYYGFTTAGSLTSAMEHHWAQRGKAQHNRVIFWVFYLFMGMRSICSSCSEDNLETRKFTFKHNQYAAVRLQLIHCQHTTKASISSPFSFLRDICYITTLRDQGWFHSECRNYREIIQIVDSPPCFFHGNTPRQIVTDKKTRSTLHRLNECCKPTASLKRPSLGQLPVPWSQHRDQQMLKKMGYEWSLPPQTFFLLSARSSWSSFQSSIFNAIPRTSPPWACLICSENIPILGHSLWP